MRGDFGEPDDLDADGTSRFGRGPFRVSAHRLVMHRTDELYEVLVTEVRGGALYNVRLDEGLDWFGPVVRAERRLIPDDLPTWNSWLDRRGQAMPAWTMTRWSVLQLLARLSDRARGRR